MSAPPAQPSTSAGTSAKTETKKITITGIVELADLWFN